MGENEAELRKGKNPVGVISLVLFFIELVGFILFFFLMFEMFVVGVISGIISFILGIIGLVRAKKHNLRSGSSKPGIILGVIAIAIGIWMLYMVFTGQKIF